MEESLIQRIGIQSLVSRFVEDSNDQRNHKLSQFALLREFNQNRDQAGSSSNANQKNQGQGTESSKKGKRDHSKIQCFRCDQYGHYASVCPDRIQKNQEANFVREDESDPGLYMMKQSEDVIALDEKQVMPKKFDSEPMKENWWYLDNGASNHMTGNKEFFSELNEKVTGRVRFGDDSSVQIAGKGSILFSSKPREQVLLMDVYYIPTLRTNIISLGQVTEIGFKVVMEGDQLAIYDQRRRQMMLVPRTINRLYKVQLNIESPISLIAKINEVDWLWHARMGHLNFDALSQLSRKGMVQGIPKINSNIHSICDSCLVGKQTQKSYPQAATYRATRLLELIHGDLCGPISPPTPAGNRIRVHGGKPDTKELTG
ncbi:hypothetical protein E3N88_42680 [Mikania micrantha]|uniref:CCHC-type domain-containing protein n=1 Tax=Mikania micrantha TaxID=192012 RepID=A0A5N6LH46_9ASTR|nr:hypothetical protein E3N88_42680 [Mikania micrantha]